MKMTDAEIRQSVLRELECDTRVDEAGVGVEVENGVVTLTGTVGSWAKRVAAQDAAHRVLGVLDVANDIEVRAADTPGRTDAELAAAVRHALEWDVFVPHTRILSTVSHGWVTLEGEVETLNEKDDAELAVRNLFGVRGVTNVIEVRTPAPAPNDLLKTIEEALERHAEREVRNIAIEVREDRVVLSGTVHSWAEREIVVGAVRGTRGIRVVEDHLRLKPRAA